MLISSAFSWSNFYSIYPPDDPRRAADMGEVYGWVIAWALPKGGYDKLQLLLAEMKSSIF